MTARQALIGFAALVAIVAGTFLALDSEDPTDVSGGDRVATPEADPRRAALPTPVVGRDEGAQARELAAPQAAPPTRDASSAEPPPDTGISGTIRGRLVDTRGAPIADEPVDLLGRRDAWQGARPRDAIHDVVDRTRSDADGRFELGARAGAMHDVLAGGRRHPRRRIVPVAAGTELEIVLSDPHTLTGLVLAQETGWPVPGARVGVHSGNDQSFSYADQEGRFSASPLLDELVILTAYAPGYDVVVSDPVAPDWGDALLELPPGKELSGTVVDMVSEEPVAGAKVTLRLLTESRPAGEPDPLDGRRVVADHDGTTDDEGRYHLTGLPSRGFRMLVEAEGYLPSTSDRYFRRTLDSEQELTLGLVPASDLTGVVVRDDEPVPGIPVSLQADRVELVGTLTDAQGAFSLPSTGWDNIARLELVARDGERWSARERLEAGELDEPRRLVLVEGLALDVLVLAEGEPQSGARVLAISERGPPTKGRTDSEGRLQLVHPLAAPDVPTVWVQARHADRQSLAEELTLSDGPHTEPIVLDLDDGAWFAGTVTGAYGQPLASAVVYTDTGRFTSTGPDGRFELGPAKLGEAGTVKLTVQATGHRSQEWEDTLPARDLALALEPLLHWRGRATDASTGEPLERVQCQLQTPGEGGEWVDVEASLKRAGQPGEFDLELPGSGHYRLRASAQDYVAAESAPLDFDGVNAPPTADLYLSPAAVLAVEVTDPSGRPVPGYRVWIVPAEHAGEREVPRGVSGEGIRQQRTDEQGQVRFNLGAGGRLRLASGPGAWLDGGAFDVAPGAVVIRRVTVPGLGGMDLILLDEQDQPVAGLAITLATSGESHAHAVQRSGTVKQALASIEVTDLPAGTYAVNVTHAAYQQVTREVRVDSGRTTPVEITLRAALDSDGG